MVPIGRRRQRLLRTLNRFSRAGNGNRRSSARILAFSLIVWGFPSGIRLCSEGPPPPAPAKPIAFFTDEAAKAGLTMRNVFGGVDTKKYIIETTGTGVAIFDYDNDGWPDIFVVNGTTLDPVPGAAQPTSHLYHNNPDGTFADVTEKAGWWPTGWGPVMFSAWPATRPTVMPGPTPTAKSMPTSSSKRTLRTSLRVGEARWA